MLFDIETGEIITPEQLHKEYEWNRKAQPNEYNYSFDEYIQNSLTKNNGTLEWIFTAPIDKKEGNKK